MILKVHTVTVSQNPPAGNSSLPSTSQELAEIFGTSDDEDDDVDFPFSLTSGLPGELSLPSTDTKKFESSLLGNADSELFLNTFHDTLTSMPQVPVTVGQTSKGSTVVQDKGGVRPGAVSYTHLTLPTIYSV